MNNNVRKSNIELIRIVAMFFIAAGHIIVHGFKSEESLLSGIYSFAFVGVNLFVLITGYFGINFKWKSLINLVGITVFYYLISLICSGLVFHETIAPFKIIALFLPITFSGYWFISAYIFLFLLSPILSFALKNITNRQLFIFIFILTYINCVSGWFFGNPINPNGYNTMNFIYLYFIGHCIRRFNIHSKLKKQYWLIFYLILSIINSFIAHFTFFEFLSSKAFEYNNPLVIAAAISLFCFISSYNFKSKTVNFIASCTLPIYLLQDGILGKTIYKFQYLFYQMHSDYLLLLIGFMLLCTICFFIISIIIEPLRKKFMNPLIDWISKIFVKFNLDVFYIPKRNN